MSDLAEETAAVWSNLSTGFSCSQSNSHMWISQAI